MISLKTLAAAALAASLCAGAAYAQDPASIAAARHDNFKKLGGAFKGILDEVKKPAPDVGVIRTNAKALDALAAQLPTWFPAGTGSDVVPKSHALPVIWQKPAEFKKDAADLVSAAHAMDVAALSGNVDSIKGAVPALGGACKACHQAFKAKDEH
jgi:cytochrome c556